MSVDGIGRHRMSALLRSAVSIDSDHPDLQKKLARGGKFAADLGKPHGEDVATWNIFRALERFDTDLWVPHLFSAAGLEPPRVASHCGARCHFWVAGRPTKARLDWLQTNAGSHGVRAHSSSTASMEGPTQIDVRLEHSEYTVIVEVKRAADIDDSVTYQTGYDQLARQLDVAEAAEGSSGRPTYVWLMAIDEARQPFGFQRFAAYRDPVQVLETCRHFSAEQARRRAERLGLLRWRDAVTVLTSLATEVETVLGWLQQQGLGK
jgi:hypothetical protein